MSQEAEEFATTPIDREVASKLSSPELSKLLYKLVDEYAKRQSDALSMYIPLPQAQPFHESSAYQRLLTGSNRAGKTLGGAAEIARIVRGMDPHSDAKRLPKRDGRIICVGKSGDHIADPVWRALAFPGAFRIIRDKHTGLWRSVRPDPHNPDQLDPYDASRRPVSLGGTYRGKEGWKPAPPLIPPSAIKKVVWENAGLNIPKKVTLNSGWEIQFYSSNSAPRLGIVADVCWFDEEIERSIWYGEMLARLVDRNGIFMWTCTPQASTPQLYDLHLQAPASEDIEETRITIDKNPYHTEQAKKRLHDSLDPEERAVRYYGEYAIAGRKVYPNYDITGMHGIEAFDIPPNWMRVAAIDPGFQRMAVLFAAINPDADEIHFYDELYVKNATAAIFGERMSNKVAGYCFEDFIIDNHMARQSTMTSGKPVGKHYSEELEKRKVSCKRHGHSFARGSDDVEGRTEALMRLLRPDETGKCLLKVHRENCPNFTKEIQNQYYKKDQPDRRDKHNPSHLVECAEYMAAYFDKGLWYRDPDPVHIEEREARRHKAFLKFAKSLQKNKHKGISLGPR